jgi:hypothetical protein
MKSQIIKKITIILLNIHFFIQFIIESINCTKGRQGRKMSRRGKENLGLINL